MVMEDLYRRLDPSERLYHYHAIAWNYHWSPADIDGLPVSQRKLYVNLIEEQIKAQNEAMKG
jgi:hypothetical protein